MYLRLVCEFLLLVYFIVWYLQFHIIAGLAWDVPVTWVHNTEYATTNLTEGSELWEAIDFDSGFIALPNDYAKSKGLPEAQPFVWDDSKGIYVVNAYHSLHCLVSTYISHRTVNRELIVISRKAFMHP